MHSVRFARYRFYSTKFVPRMENERDAHSEYTDMYSNEIESNRNRTNRHESLDITFLLLSLFQKRSNCNKHESTWRMRFEMWFFAWTMKVVLSIFFSFNFSFWSCSFRVACLHLLFGIWSPMLCIQINCINALYLCVCNKNNKTFSITTVQWLRQTAQCTCKQWIYNSNQSQANIKHETHVISGSVETRECYSEYGIYSNEYEHCLILYLASGRRPYAGVGYLTARN